MTPPSPPSVPLLGPNLVEALAFAMAAHASDVRKGTAVPYVSHLMQVAGMVLEFGGNELETIAALLHDAAEDAGGEEMLLKIEHAFGPVVAGIVRENSDSLTPDKGHKAPWRERKETYIAAVSHKSESACLVSIADKIHNARSLVSDNLDLDAAHWDRFNASREDSRWYYESLANAFAARAAEFPRLQRPLAELVRTIERL